MPKQKHHVFRRGDETHITTDPAGYEDWTLVGTASRAPEDDEFFDEQAQAWKSDKAAREERARHATARDPLHLLNRIEALERKVAQLEARANTK